MGSADTKDMATVSVIIPTYNHARELRRCLESIWTQTFKNFEVIVVDDGSTDETSRVVEECKESVRAIRIPHSGANAARNSGFKESSGRYVLFCDADIRMKPTMLQDMVAALEVNPDASFAYSSFRFGWKLFRLFPFDAERLRRENYIHTTSLIRREHFPCFDENIRRLQDWDLWLTMAKQGRKGIWIPKVLFSVKPRREGMSAWLPRIAYKIPWKRLGIRIKRLEQYEEARRIIAQKHGLNSHIRTDL